MSVADHTEQSVMEKGVAMRTPIPSDWQQTRTLMKRDFRNDKKKPRLWFARTFLGPCLWMLYTMGYLFNTPDDQKDFVEVGDYRLFSGTTLPTPTDTVYLAGNVTTSLLETIQEDLGSSYGLNTSIVTDVNKTAFQDFCDVTIGDVGPASQVCVFLDSDLDYTILFGGGQSIPPFDGAISGTQSSVQESILRANNFTLTDLLFPVSMVQKVPELIYSSQQGASTFFLLFPGAMLALASAITMQFITAPLSTEKFKEVVRSFVLVGVKLRVYLRQWFLYLSLNATLTAALLTMVSIVWGMFSRSSGGLIFLSHYLALVHMVSVALLISQGAEQEELAQGLPFLFGIVGMAIATPIILFAGPDSIGLFILTAFSPFIGMMQYSAIYENYDSTGYGVGIHVGDNVVESGLLGNIIGQLVGICLFSLITLWWKATPKRREVQDATSTHDEDTLSGDDFEPLPPGSDVLLTVRDLDYTYQPKCCRRSKPVEVLKGLDMDICRGEVFSYLGVNGAGKTTSVNILSGELPMQEGSVTYHLQNGDASLASPEDAARIRKHVGVCPQHNDSLHEDASCREMLHLFATLKGNIPQSPGQSVEEAIDSEVDRRLEDIQFTSPEDADKLIDTYSGGMKRKVCIALALLGEPEVIFLDEPTAGMDPYNRRQVWDMIIAAKEGRSIILTTHFMDEADVLGDRVGIIRDGHLVTSGSTLFLKHHFGAGYTLRFDAPESVDISSLIDGAEPIPLEKPGSYEWSLQHGTEPAFPDALRTLNEKGATNVDLELTTLEQVFLEMGKSDDETEVESEDQEGEVYHDEHVDVEDPVSTSDYLRKIWKRETGAITTPSYTTKFMQVQRFMLTNAWRIKGSVFLNILMPITYLVIGIVIVSLVDIEGEQRVEPEPILMSPFLSGSVPSQCFGLPELQGNPIAPMIPTEPPTTIEEYFVEGVIPVSCGYWADNSTLQYNESLSPFALQVGLQVLANYTVLLGGGSDGLTTQLQQLSYMTEVGFRIDLLLLPMMLAFGFAGMAFSVLDVLLLKADNIIGLFRVTGITEWTTYLGVMWYKCTTTFAPFFVLVIILGFALNSVLMGNAGRWLATILIMLAYAFSNTVIGLLIAKRFIKTDFKAVANWFPGVYMTLVSLPYLAWSLAIQFAPSARDALLIVADVLCLIPPFAFQRALGAVIVVSTEADDPDLTWGDVWRWPSRIWFCLLMMVVVGAAEWVYLYYLTTTRPPKTKLGKDELSAAVPVDVSAKEDIKEERDRSLVDDDGINARDLVKLFRVKPPKGSKNKEDILKEAVKGVSFGVKENEVYVMLGPNGSGKTTQMQILAGEYTADNGEFALEGEKLTPEDRSVSRLYKRGNISYCQQFDALFPRMTAMEHLRFYAKMRGLAWDEESTQEHIDAIVKLTGLQNHREKMSTELSGGYKRRLCLAVAMIGYPKCMLVDECTTGMDPSARHLVWRVLKPDSRDGYDLPAILLSTHYMDEAEKLGSRIGILIDGELVTTGSLASLQERYCNSFFVEIALTPGAPDDAQEKVLEAFEQEGMRADIYEALPYHFKLQVPFQYGNHLEQLATIFGLLETRQEALHVKFYSVAQMNLEQIFIDLSRKQFAADESTRRL